MSFVRMYKSMCAGIKPVLKMECVALHCLCLSSSPWVVQSFVTFQGGSWGRAGPDTPSQTPHSQWSRFIQRFSPEQSTPSSRGSEAALAAAGSCKVLCAGRHGRARSVCLEQGRRVHGIKVQFPRLKQQHILQDSLPACACWEHSRA